MPRRGRQPQLRLSHPLSGGERACTGARLIDMDGNDISTSPTARIECFMNELKNFRRIATRYDQPDSSFVGFILLGCIRIWIRVHAADACHALIPPTAGVACETIATDP